MTDSGRKLWVKRAQPKIYGYYEQALDGFTVTDTAHALHYLLKILENMKRIDEVTGPADLDRRDLQPAGHDTAQ